MLAKLNLHADVARQHYYTLALRLLLTKLNPSAAS
jgi:hypothetical protein